MDRPGNKSSFPEIHGVEHLVVGQGGVEMYTYKNAMYSVFKTAVVFGGVLTSLAI